MLCNVCERRYPEIIDALHTGTPCYECGQRFILSNVSPGGNVCGTGNGNGTGNELAHYRAHLDAHFQEKRRELHALESARSQGSRHRKWYLLLDEWHTCALPARFDQRVAQTRGDVQDVQDLVTEEHKEHTQHTQHIVDVEEQTQQLPNQTAQSTQNTANQHGLPTGYRLDEQPAAESAACEVRLLLFLFPPTIHLFITFSKFIHPHRYPIFSIRYHSIKIPQYAGQLF